MLGRPQGLALLPAAVVVLASCVDVFAPQARRASLNIVPVFQGQTARDGTPTDVDSFHVRISNPPQPDVILGVRVPPGQDSVVLTVLLELNGQQDTVTVQFSGYNTTTGRLLYQGSQNVAVRAGTPLPPQPVPATYVGPGAGVDSVIVAPNAASLPAGGTQQLTYTGYDNNLALPDDSVPVYYQTGDSLVARVSNAGLVTAVANGQARVFVISLANSSLRDTALITVTATPAVIVLAPSTLAFLDTTGTANPAAQSVSVSNGGGGTLSGLTVGTISYGPGATGWISSTTFSGANAPATFTVNVSNAGLLAGSYTAQVQIVSPVASNSPQTLTVTYTLSAPLNPPVIALTPNIITFTDTVQTANPAQQTVSVTNVGGGTLSGLAVGTVSYGPGATGWLTPGLSQATAPATLTLNASNSGLAPGTYTAAVPVTSGVASNSPQTVAVTYVVSPLPVPAGVAVTPGYVVLSPAGTQNLTTVVRDAGGTDITATNPPTYLSRSPGVATVNAAGQVTAVAGGTAVIVATSGAAADSVAVSVAATGSAVFSVIADSRAFDRVAVGDTVRVVAAIDLRGVAPEKLGSYNVQLIWNQAVLRYVRDTTIISDFTAPTVNRTNVTNGDLRFGSADPVGVTGPTVVLLRITYVAQATGITPLTAIVTDISAAITFTNLLTNALLYSGGVRVQ